MTVGGSTASGKCDSMFIRVCGHRCSWYASVECLVLGQFSRVYDNRLSCWADVWLESRDQVVSRMENSFQAEEVDCGSCSVALSDSDRHGSLAHVQPVQSADGRQALGGHCRSQNVEVMLCLLTTSKTRLEKRIRMREARH